VPTTATTIPKVTTRIVRPEGRSSGAYFWLLLFIIFYFYRPGDWIPGLEIIPIEKITGTLALLGFGVGLLTRRQSQRMQPETLYLILLFAQFCLTIPFAYWRGGAFQIVFYGIAKVVMVAIAAAVIVNTWPQLRRLLLVQATAVPVLAAAALIRRHTGEGGRLIGVGAHYDNPNDFAFLMTLTFPFCFAFLLSTRNPVAKVAWSVGMAMMGVALIMTASRVGLLTIVLGGGMCLWQFGVKGRRPFLVFVAILLALSIVAVAGPGHLIRRLTSTFTQEEQSAYASAQIRRELLEKSVLTAIEHPFFGVGPGNFAVLSGVWKEAHNSFTEIAAEAGFPALILFLLYLSRGFANVRQVKQLCVGQTDKSLLAGAMQASLATFVVGAMFTTWEYQYPIYLLVSYSTAFRRIVTTPEGAAPSRFPPSPLALTSPATSREKS
jgi:O-Antigen ligase